MSAKHKAIAPLRPPYVNINISLRLILYSYLLMYFFNDNIIINHIIFNSIKNTIAFIISYESINMSLFCLNIFPINKPVIINNIVSNTYYTKLHTECK